MTGLAAAATGRAVRTARQLPGQTAGAAASVAREALSVGQSLRREAAPVSRGLLDLHPARARRRVWSGQGHAHIEVRGMTGGGQQHRRLAAGVTRRMRRLRGVRWAEVNAVTGQVLVAFDEGRVNVGTLLDVVRDVEKTHGTREESFPWSRPVHPSDATPIAAAAVELTADCLAVATALGARMSRLPPPPRGPAGGARPPRAGADRGRDPGIVPVARHARSRCAVPRIVEALQQAGHVVAMTGDGTNDAAAIRLADVGIGVAATGSSSARPADDLVLADADVRRIHDALLEGRGLWHRVRDAVSILVGGNAGEVAFMVLGTAVAGRAPINVRQLLVVNMLTDMFPALAVAVAPSRNGADVEEPTGTLGAPLARSVAVRGSATTLGATLAWTIGRCTGRGRRAGSMGLAALVGTQLGQTLLTGWHSPLVVATTLASAAALVALVETPGISQFFGCTPIGPAAWGVVLAAATAGTLAAALMPRLLPAGDREQAPTAPRP